MIPNVRPIVSNMPQSSTFASSHRDSGRLTYDAQNTPRFGMPISIQGPEKEVSNALNSAIRGPLYNLPETYIQAAAVYPVTAQNRVALPGYETAKKKDWPNQKQLLFTLNHPEQEASFSQAILASNERPMDYPSTVIETINMPKSDPPPFPKPSSTKPMVYAQGSLEDVNTVLEAATEVAGRDDESYAIASVRTEPYPGIKGQYRMVIGLPRGQNAEAFLDAVEEISAPYERATKAVYTPSEAKGLLPKATRSKIPSSKGHKALPPA
jgi:hypothetical protein